MKFVFSYLVRMSLPNFNNIIESENGFFFPTKELLKTNFNQETKSVRFLFSSISFFDRLFGRTPSPIVTEFTISELSQLTHSRIFSKNYPSLLEQEIIHSVASLRFPVDQSNQILTRRQKYKSSSVDLPFKTSHFISCDGRKYKFDSTACKWKNEQTGQLEDSCLCEYKKISTIQELFRSIQRLSPDIQPYEKAFLVPQWISEKQFSEKDFEKTPNLSNEDMRFIWKNENIYNIWKKQHSESNW